MQARMTIVPAEMGRMLRKRRGTTGLLRIGCFLLAALATAAPTRGDILPLSESASASGGPGYSASWVDVSPERITLFANGSYTGYWSPGNSWYISGGGEWADAGASVLVSGPGYIYFWMVALLQVGCDSAYWPLQCSATAKAQFGTDFPDPFTLLHMPVNCWRQDRVSDQPYISAKEHLWVSREYPVSAAFELTITLYASAFGSGAANETHSGYNAGSASVMAGVLFTPTILDNPESQVPIPEPVTLSLLALGGLAVLRRRAAVGKRSFGAAQDK